MSIIIMIVKHRYLDPQFVKVKKTLVISQADPVHLIISTKFTFMNRAVESLLKRQHIHYKLEQCCQSKLNQHYLPCIVFQSYILSGCNMVSFLCDLQLPRCRKDQYISRKYQLHQTYSSWQQIITHEYSLSPLSSLSHLGITTKHEYQNYAFQQFQKLSLISNPKLIQRVFSDYGTIYPSIEELVYSEIVIGVKELCGQSLPQYMGIVYFHDMIDIGYNVRNLEVRGYNDTEVELLLDEEQKDRDRRLDLVRLNPGKFAIWATLISGIYAYMLFRKW